MTDAPERIWHSIDRKGKINGSPDAHVQPCEGSLPAYVEYVRADLAPSWQPIETAPKDVTVLFWNGEDVCEGSYEVTDWWSEGDRRDREYGLPLCPQPTHWMPLPAPPTE